ncbi:hypothetical protein L195_g049741, partial [Trifolium pratense]
RSDKTWWDDSSMILEEVVRHGESGGFKGAPWDKRLFFCMIPVSFDASQMLGGKESGGGLKAWLQYSFAS